MGVIQLSKKVKRSPVVGARYWAERDMYDFMPSVAYDVPVEGDMPDAATIRELTNRIYLSEKDMHLDDVVGVHIEPHSRGYLTITIGVFAT